jgi:hypothetical protein
VHEFVASVTLPLSRGRSRVDGLQITDAETLPGTPNGRADVAAGFGLLNIAGSHSDVTTVCRVVFID